MLSTYHLPGIVPGTVPGAVPGTGQTAVTIVDKSLFVELITYGTGGRQTEMRLIRKISDR